MLSELSQQEVFSDQNGHPVGRHTYFEPDLEDGFWELALEALELALEALGEAFELAFEALEEAFELALEAL